MLIAASLVVKLNWPCAATGSADTKSSRLETQTLLKRVRIALGVAVLLMMAFSTFTFL
jgi:hypothetical protein